MSSKRPRVLLAAPVSDRKDYILPRWLEYIEGLTWKPDILLIDNSQDPAYYKKLLQYKHISAAHYQPPRGAGIRAIMAACLEYIRAFVLKAGYDYFFSLECDVFPPLNIIESLISHRAPVMAASYFYEIAEKSVLLAQEVEPNVAHAATRPLNHYDAFIFCDGTTKPAYMPALGCTLIRRDILQMARFYVTNADTCHADSNFFRDLFFLGIEVKQDTAIICDHYNTDWTEIYKTAKIWN